MAKMVQDVMQKDLVTMQAKAVRRLPVVSEERPVGIVSLGDLALERDPHSVLGSISGSPPNR